MWTMLSGVAHDPDTGSANPTFTAQRYASRMNGHALGAEASRRLVDLGVDIGPGLAPAELAEAERRHGFTFADDHRAFLAAGAPVGGRWPDWRADDVPTLGWPV